MLRVLTYHRVAPLREDTRLDPRLISATPEVFARQMAHLAKYYEVVSAETVLNSLETGVPLPRRAVMITFDDSYRDFGEIAWPILQRYRLPVTLFVPTAYPGNPHRAFWWDRLYCALCHSSQPELTGTPVGALPLGTREQRLMSLRRLQAHVKSIPHREAMQLVEEVCDGLPGVQPPLRTVLDWDELRKLAREGVTVASHTRTHPILTQLSREQIREEAEGSRQDLERELGAVLPLFCYPNGSHDDVVANIIREAGYEIAFTGLDGHNELGSTDPLRLRRTNITRRTSPAIFRLRLLRLFTYLDAWRHSRRQRQLSSLSDVASPSRGPSAALREAAQKPRVAYIMSRFPKLTETFILYEMLAMERLGVAVEIYPLLRTRQRVRHAEAERLVQRAHFHPFLSLPILHAQWHFLRQRPREYVKLLAEILCGTYRSLNFLVGAIGIFPKAVRFAYEMPRAGITHIHAHFATHPAVAALIVHRLTGIPFSFTAHGSDLHVDKTMLAEKVKAAAFAVTVSRYNKEVMLAEGGEAIRDKVRVVHCGVDANSFPIARPRASGGSFQILCVASFEEVKGHRYLVEACELLRDRGVNFTCQLVGEGPLHKTIQRQISAAGLEAHFRIHGTLPRSGVLQLLAQADVMALASVPTRNGKREGIPVALMEGMAADLPVVASAISGIPELVENGISGFLAPSRDSVSLANALERLSKDLELRQRLGRAARDKVLREFNLELNAARLAELFGWVTPSGSRTTDELAQPDRGSATSQTRVQELKSVPAVLDA